MSRRFLHACQTIQQRGREIKGTQLRPLFSDWMARGRAYLFCSETAVCIDSLALCPEDDKCIYYLNCGAVNTCQIYCYACLERKQ
jgi:hypothetical protein